MPSLVRLLLLAMDGEMGQALDRVDDILDGKSRMWRPKHWTCLIWAVVEPSSPLQYIGKDVDSSQSSQLLCLSPLPS